MQWPQASPGLQRIATLVFGFFRAQLGIRVNIRQPNLDFDLRHAQQVTRREYPRVPIRPLTHEDSRSYTVLLKNDVALD